MKYHQRRALRDAFFDVKIIDAVTEADAKKIYDEKIVQVKPEQESARPPYPGGHRGRGQGGRRAAEEGR